MTTVIDPTPGRKVHDHAGQMDIPPELRSETVARFQSSSLDDTQEVLPISWSSVHERSPP